MKDMIGRAVRLIVDVPLNFLGTVCDLLEKLAGKESGEIWFKELKKFLLKKPCWTGVADSISEFLKLISAGETLTVDALDGEEILAEAADVFVYIDPNFKNWNADECGEATKKTAVEVHELVKDGTFTQFFGSICGDISKLCFTQAQIKNFCIKHRDWLKKEGYATLFLFKSHNNFFVANVNLTSGGRLRVDVNEFGNDSVWDADDRDRVVVPQLA